MVRILSPELVRKKTFFLFTTTAGTVQDRSSSLPAPYAPFRQTPPLLLQPMDQSHHGALAKPHGVSGAHLLAAITPNAPPVVKQRSPASFHPHRSRGANLLTPAALHATVPLGAPAWKPGNAG